MQKSQVSMSSWLYFQGLIQVKVQGLIYNIEIQEKCS